MMLKTLNSTYNTLAYNLPFELTARYFAAYNDVNKKVCKDYSAIAAPNDPDRQAALC